MCSTKSSPETISKIESSVIHSLSQPLVMSTSMALPTTQNTMVSTFKVLKVWNASPCASATSSKESLIGKQDPYTITNSLLQIIRWADSLLHRWPLLLLTPSILSRLTLWLLISSFPSFHQKLPVLLQSLTHFRFTLSQLSTFLTPWETKSWQLFLRASYQTLHSLWLLGNPCR